MYALGPGLREPAQIKMTARLKQKFLLIEWAFPKRSPSLIYFLSSAQDKKQQPWSIVSYLSCTIASCTCRVQRMEWQARGLGALSPSTITQTCSGHTVSLQV